MSAITIDVMTVLFQIEIVSGQPSTLTCQQAPWMSFITKNHKDPCHFHGIATKDKEMKKTQLPMNLQ